MGQVGLGCFTALGGHGAIYRNGFDDPEVHTIGANIRDRVVNWELPRWLWSAPPLAAFCYVA